MAEIKPKDSFRVWPILALLVVGYICVQAYGLRPEVHCIITKDTLGAADEVTTEAYDKAKKIKDDMGIFELVQQRRLFLASAGTEGLVIETGMDCLDPSRLHFRRKVRLLSGVNIGTAVWIGDES